MKLLTLATMLWMLTGGIAFADVLQLAPTASALVSDTGVGVHKIAVRFDLSGMREGQYRRIEFAHLEWPLQAISAGATTVCRASEITATWNFQSTTIAAGREVAMWEFEPADYQRNKGGVIRLDIRELVRAWASGERTNYGIMIASGDITGADLISEVGHARLVIGYGFIADP